MTIDRQANEPGSIGASTPDQEASATPEKRGSSPPRIYVASLSDYNAGVLHGVWLNADQETDVLEIGVQAMLRDSVQDVAEEWAIHDFDGFGPLGLSEYESLEAVSRIAQGIARHGLAFGAWASLVGGDPGALRRFEEAYQGHWSSVVEYADEFLDDAGATQALEAIPDWLQPYVTLNSEGFARDLVLGGDIQSVEGEGGVWIFEGHL